jgi:anaerobic magnesium-protoporphyrin IX monomethyl ester cyclase
MRLTLISPRIAIQKGDFLGSGVPYWPLELAIFAGFLREHGHTVKVLDLFAATPWRLSDEHDHYLQGIPLEHVIDKQQLYDTEIFIVYALSYMSHSEVLNITHIIKGLYPKIPVAILENSQAVTAYSLTHVADSMLRAGADALICGEPYHNWEEIEQYLSSTQHTPAPENMVTQTNSNTNPHRLISRNFTYSFPAWDLFPYRNYWSLPYSHGPKTRTYFPVLTSRGCTFPCDFCVVPETNAHTWRSRSPQEVVLELTTLRDHFGVHDFQVEDLNPTLHFKRWERISELLLERGLGIRYYFVSGTKAESIPVDQIPLLAKSGCRYLSISPETGSLKLLKVMGKGFNHAHALRLIAACRAYGIRTQACMLVGHPQESDEDFRLSLAYLREMVASGLDEVGIFIIAAMAGSKLYNAKTIQTQAADSLVSFSPKGRVGYQQFEDRRRQLINTFFKEKLRKDFQIYQQCARAILGTPETKMENLPRRAVYVYWLQLKHTVQKFYTKGSTL